MSHDDLSNPHLILSPGTRVVTLHAVCGPGGAVQHPRGAVGTIVASPIDGTHAYRVRFLDGFESPLRRHELVLLTRYQEGQPTEDAGAPLRSELYQRVIYRCVVGSRAYGLDDEHSDTDYRGVYLPPAESHWSLFGVPDQIECQETQEHYWELQRYLILALKSNPNVLESLYTSQVVSVTPLGEELLAMRSCFLSRLVYQTYNGYVMSQFKKMRADLRNQGQVKWKHVMHLLRLLIAGVAILENGEVPVQAGDHRDRLLAVKRGEVPWAETEAWRLELHRALDRALAHTNLPERPDYDRANAFLLRARRAALADELP